MFESHFLKQVQDNQSDKNDYMVIPHPPDPAKFSSIFMIIIEAALCLIQAWRKQNRTGSESNGSLPPWDLGDYQDWEGDGRCREMAKEGSLNVSFNKY